MRRRWKELSPARRWSAAGCAGLILAALALMLVLPAGRESAMALANRVFERSEAVNAYVYERFPVAEDVGMAPAAVLLGLAGAGALGLAFVWPGRGPALTMALAAAGAQAWLGLALPAGANVGLYALLGVAMMQGRDLRRVAAMLGAVLLAFLAVTAAWPGTDAGVEAASEQVRDLLGAAPGQVQAQAAEGEDGVTPVRHENRRDLTGGDGAAQTDGTYRLVMVEEQQIALPRWTDWLRIALLCLLIPAALTAPFAPFVWMNARARLTAQRRACLDGEDDTAAMTGAFRLVVGYLDACGIGGANSLYVARLAGVADVPGDYPAAYLACAGAWQEVVYGGRGATPEERAASMRLLEATEEWLYDAADRRTRFRLKYRDCLHE